MLAAKLYQQTYLDCFREAFMIFVKNELFSEREDCRRDSKWLWSALWEHTGCLYLTFHNHIEMHRRSLTVCTPQHSWFSLFYPLILSTMEERDGKSGKLWQESKYSTSISFACIPSFLIAVLWNIYTEASWRKEQNLKLGKTSVTFYAIFYWFGLISSCW